MRSCAAYLATQRRSVFSIAAGEPDSGLDGIVQVELRPEFHFGRLNALRATLESRPDALRVDLIDTPEIARLVVGAAARGIAVVSSIVATDSAHGVLRLLELGVEPRQLAQAVRLVVSCRLPRRLCLACSEATASPTATSLWRMVPRLMEERVLADWQQARAPGIGCERCHGGYRDRVPVFEVLRLTSARMDRLNAAPEGAAKLACLRERTRGLREGAMLLAEAGVTSVVEALRVTPAAEVGEHAAA
jgi:type IV pilus assembly protein PilB